MKSKIIVCVVVSLLCAVAVTIMKIKHGEVY